MQLASYINTVISVSLSVSAINNVYIKLFYLVSNKMDHFSYKGGCSVHVSRHLKEELTWYNIFGARFLDIRMHQFLFELV